MSLTASSNLRQRILVAVASLGLALMSVALLLVRWAVAPPRPVSLDLGDPGLSASHFYVPEEADGVGFRWSRTASALSLPALGTSQVISVTLNPARPADTPPVHFRLSLGAQTLGSYEAQPGWTTYTATVGPGLGPDLRLIMDSETFYPGPGDRRKLGMAVSEVSTAPREGRAGLRLPPYLWLLSAILLPLSATVLGTRRSLYYGMVAGVCAALLPTIASLLLPPAISLPAMSWLAGIAAAILLLYYALRITGADPRPSPTNEIITREEGDHMGSPLQPNDPGENHPKATTYNTQYAIRNTQLQELGMVALFMALLAVLFTWPLAARLGSSMPGWPADNFAFLY
ncbi:MAG: hypothetical protein WCD37_14245, partial [Chloroflexia bacterium]